jgi:hypothetical protein
MYVDGSFYYQFAERQDIEVRERFKQYYRDLHDRYNEPLDETTFANGSGYKFNELGYPIFDYCLKHGYLKKIDLMIASYWAHEFDPDHASCGPHFAHKYDFDCNMFDVLDQGSICTLTALNLIKKYQDNNASQNALCFALDQNSIPCAANGCFPMPTKNVAAAAMLSKQQTDNSFIKILDIKLWSEQKICDLRYDILADLLKTLEEKNLSLTDCIICCKRNTAVYRAIELYKYQHLDIKDKLQFYFQQLDCACSDSLYLIDQLNQKAWQPKEKYVLILEEDVESLACGLLMLELLR